MHACTPVDSGDWPYNVATPPGISPPDPGFSARIPGISPRNPGFSARIPGISSPNPGFSARIPGISPPNPGISVGNPGISGRNSAFWGRYCGKNRQNSLTASWLSINHPKLIKNRYLMAHTPRRRRDCRRPAISRLVGSECICLENWYTADV